MFFTILTMLKSNGRDAINSFKYTQKDYKPLLSFKGDTSAYILYNFVENQNCYYQKPLKTLLSKLEIPVVSCIPLTTGLDDGPVGIYGVELKFYDIWTIDRKIAQKKEPAILVIFWNDLMEKEPAIEFGKMHYTIKETLNYYMSSASPIKKISYVSYYHRKILEDSVKKAQKEK
jgi:hypothetical protein